jgi:hypothetical protein
MCERAQTRESREGSGTSPRVTGESWSSSRRAQRLRASALGMFYLAVMNGRMSSYDGLIMARQAYTFVFEHAIRFQIPLWTWRPEPMWNSMYGIGLSLLYTPGMFLSSALRSRVPISVDTPSDLWAFYLRELHDDPLYTVGASWVHAVIVATAAYLVARLITELGGSRRAAFWGMVFYGLGSSALVYSRGDFSQPLEGLCWTAALLAAVSFRATCKRTTLAACGAAVFYAILTRPVEGMLLVPAVITMVLPAGSPFKWRLAALKPALAPGLGALMGVVVTLLVNWIRFGDALQFGYGDDNTWVMPDVTRWIGVLVSPGRGILWEFPAVILIPFGTVALARVGRRREAAVILVLCAALLTNTAAWYMWWGGHSWGLRLFGPAIPLLAVVAGVGVDRLRGWTRRWVPAVLLFLGFVWALPGVITDILGGYGDLGENVWPLTTYPPYGAWQFLERIRPNSLHDAGAVDILWFRLADVTGSWSLLVPVVLVAISAALVYYSLRLTVDEERR